MWKPALSVVPMCRHNIGKIYHDEPQVLHYRSTANGCGRHDATIGSGRENACIRNIAGWLDRGDRTANYRHIERGSVLIAAAVMKSPACRVTFSDLQREHAGGGNRR
ncbi:MAG: hypothetical protein U1F19_06315 [Lysobacterales bacterium]